METSSPSPQQLLADLTVALQHSLSILHKQDIQTAAHHLGQYVPSADHQTVIQLGDDCAAIPDGDGYLLLAAEGMWPQLIMDDPWFAGWCAVMVNISDIAAMGGSPIALVDALWSTTLDASQPLWQGMQAATKAYGIPIVGGHTNCHSPYDGLAVAILGRAKHLITSFSAQPGDVLMLVIDMAGRYYSNYPFWNAATDADPTLLRKKLALLPELAQTKLCHAGKDISMGGIVGTLLMLAEASQCGAVLDLQAIPRPQNTPWTKWLTSFPSYGFLLSLPPEHTAQIQAIFHSHDLTCVPIGKLTQNPQIYLKFHTEQNLLWDLQKPFTGFGMGDWSNIQNL